MTNRRGATTTTGAQSLTNTERLHRALQLRRGGATFQQIVDAGLYSHVSTAQRAIMRYYRRLHRDMSEDAEAIRWEEVDRLDAMLRSLWPSAVNANSDKHLQSVDRVVKLMQQRAKLLGLDAPEKHEVTGRDGAALIPPSVDLSNLDSDQLEQVRQIMEQATDGSRSPTG